MGLILGLPPTHHHHSPLGHIIVFATLCRDREPLSGSPRQSYVTTASLLGVTACLESGRLTCTVHLMTNLVIMMHSPAAPSQWSWRAAAGRHLAQLRIPLPTPLEQQEASKQKKNIDSGENFRGERLVATHAHAPGPHVALT